MKIYNFLVLSVATILSLLSCGTKTENKSETVDNKPFVKIENGKFSLNGNPYTFRGANYWYALNLAAQGEDGRKRLCRELDSLKSYGINNLRVQMCSEGDFCYTGNNSPSLQPKPGIFNKEMFEACDFFISEIEKRGIYAVMILNNYWFWSGGMPWYVEQATGEKVPIPDDKPGAWDRFMAFSDRFYNTPEAQKLFLNAVDTILNRKNSITGRFYKDEPAVMSWQLANEPRNGNNPQSKTEMLQWVKNTADYIKTIDNKHLVSIGSEGEAGHWFDFNHWKNIHSHSSVDYVTIHLWPQNWSWFNPEDEAGTIDKTLQNAADYISRHVATADSLGKPSVVEEFGMARDGGSFSPDGSTVYRNKFMQFVFNFTDSLSKSSGLSGTNFWGFSGEGVSKTFGKPWHNGDPFGGDPPHEIQGWYGIYFSDSQTINVIKK